MVNCCGIYLFKLLHRLYHCLERNSLVVLYVSWWFNCQCLSHTQITESCLRGGLLFTPCPERSLKTCVLFPWKLGTPNCRQDIYHHSPWVLSLIVRNTFLKSSVSWAGPLWLSAFFTVRYYVKAKRPEPTGHCYQSSVKWQMLI